MPRPVPAGPPPAPVAQRLVIRYAKRGRMRFASHRDIARTVERGVRKASLPIAYSAGFSPHPKISYAGAAPTGTASEAEYLEIALTDACCAPEVRDRLDAALPDGIDVIEVLELADAQGGIAALRLEASQWQMTLPGVTPGEAARAVQAFLDAPSVVVERHTSKGTRRLDARAAVVTLELDRRAVLEADAGCVILRMVVRHLTPAVRPDDILAALSTMATLAPSSPPVVTRLAQGALGMEAAIGGTRTSAADPGELAMLRPSGLTAAGPAGPAAAGPAGPAAAGPAGPAAAGPTPLSPGWAAAKGQEKETRVADAGTAAADNAAAATALASAYEQLPRGAGGPAFGPRAREYDRRLPGCSKPSDSIENQTTTTGRPELATPLR
jgi:radical SAM-linked protein